MKELWDKGDNSSVALEKKIPVHMVYFTAVVDESGKVATFADVYGLDRKLAAALFGDATGFPSRRPNRSSRQPEKPMRQHPRRAGDRRQRLHAGDGNWRLGLRVTSWLARRPTP